MSPPQHAHFITNTIDMKDYFFALVHLAFDNIGACLFQLLFDDDDDAVFRIAVFQLYVLASVLS